MGTITTMKRIAIILITIAITSCDKPMELTTPVTEPDTVTVYMGVQQRQSCGECVPTFDTVPPPPVDTLDACCEVYNSYINRVFLCHTANGDCTECFDWCSEMGKR